MKAFFQSKHFLILFVLFIVFTGFLLRFWKFEELFYFAIDEEKSSFIIDGIINGAHFPSVTFPSSIGFRQGPLALYLISPFYYLFTASPLVWGYLSVLTFIFTMLVLYKTTIIISKTAAFTALVLFAFSPLNVLYERRGWQLSFHSLIALLFLFAVYKLSLGNKKYFFLLSALIVISSQLEMALLLFIPWVFIMLILIKPKIPRLWYIVSLAVFLISLIPQLFFDIRHNFLNSKYLLNYFVPTAEVRIKKNEPLKGIKQVYLAHNLIPHTLTRFLTVPRDKDINIQYANCPQYLDKKFNDIPKMAVFFTLTGLTSFILYSFFAPRAKNNIILKGISVYFIIISFGISVFTYLFNGEMAEYYLLSFIAFFFIAGAFIISKTIRNKLLIFIILLGWAFMNIKYLTGIWASYGYSDKIKAVEFALKHVNDEPFILNSVQTCWYSGGYRYLFRLAGKEPETSYMDEYLNEYYTVGQKKPLYEVYILTPELAGPNPEGFEDTQKFLEDKSFAKGNFGATKVFIKETNNL